MGNNKNLTKRNQSLSGWNVLFQHKNSVVTKKKLLNVIPKHNILYIKHRNKAKRQVRKKQLQQPQNGRSIAHGRGQPVRGPTM